MSLSPWVLVGGERDVIMRCGRRLSGWNLSYPTHDEETVMNGAPGMCCQPTLAAIKPAAKMGHPVSKNYMLVWVPRMSSLWEAFEWLESELPHP
jgi:hypothetical protein